MRKKQDGSIFEEAYRDALSKLYDLTSNHPDFYFSPQVVAARIGKHDIYGNVESYEAENLLAPFVDEGLVQKVMITARSNPDEGYDSDIRRGYRANLDREEEIQRRISQ